VPLFNPGDSRHQRREGSTELFAAASFRRSRSGAPLQPTPLQRRGCGLPVDLLGPCGAFTKPCRPLTFPLSPAGTPESKSFSPDVLSYHWLANLAAYRGRRGVDLLVRGPGSAAVVSHHDGPKPENAFRRVRDLRAFTHKRHIAKSFGLLNTPVPFRLLSIRARTSGGATDFFLASALFCHHPTLRSTGEEDARCAEPTSATQTKTCTRTSRVPDSLRNFRCVDVPRRLRLRTTFGDSKVSRPSRSLRRTGLVC